MYYDPMLQMPEPSYGEEFNWNQYAFNPVGPRKRYKNYKKMQRTQSPAVDSPRNIMSAK